MLVVASPASGHHSDVGMDITTVVALEDPEYLDEPMTHARELVYSPHMQRFQFNCDPEATSRFLAD